MGLQPSSVSGREANGEGIGAADDVRQPKRFTILCVAAPGTMALGCAAFALSVRVSGTLVIAGLVLSCALFVWSLLSLRRHWRRTLGGFVSLLIAFCFLGVMADVFAVHHRRKEFISLTNQIEAAGGIIALQRDCRLYFERSVQRGREAWVMTMGDSNGLPPTIAALRPQTVVADRTDLPVVNIQLSGGFNHYGLLVCVTNTPANFWPRSKWLVSKIAEGVFVYRE